MEIASAPVTAPMLGPSSERAGPVPAPAGRESAMRIWPLVAMALVMAALGLGTFFAALDVAKSSLTRTLQVQPHGPTGDEMGRLTCRRNNFSDPQRPLPRIGCP